MKEGQRLHLKAAVPGVGEGEVAAMDVPPEKELYYADQSWWWSGLRDQSPVKPVVVGKFAAAAEDHSDGLEGDLSIVRYTVAARLGRSAASRSDKLVGS